MAFYDETGLNQKMGGKVEGLSASAPTLIDELYHEQLANWELILRIRNNLFDIRKNLVGETGVDTVNEVKPQLTYGGKLADFKNSIDNMNDVLLEMSRILDELKQVV